MSVSIVVTLATVVANLAIAIADLLQARFVLANSDRVGVPRPWIPRLAALKTAGAAGLIIGFWWAPIGIAAAAGLVLFFVVAAAAHIRVGAYATIVFPITYLLLALACLVLQLR